MKYRSQKNGERESNLVDFVFSKVSFKWFELFDRMKSYKILEQNLWISDLELKHQCEKTCWSKCTSIFKS